jgi:DNA-binding response OmpR family regulator/HPt (histidine-containing phosphotransfer) domain-containing protein
MKILLVDDDAALTEVLSKHLLDNNFVVDVVSDGEAGWTYGSTFEYDLFLLDLRMPKLNGLELCQRFREEEFTTPIILLTSEHNSQTKVQCLEAGADDYVVKPIDLPELIARIRALLRRAQSTPLPILSWGDLLLNSGTCEVFYDGNPVQLTTKEYELLEMFLRDSQHVFSSEEILDKLWSSEEFPVEATVRSHIRRLRQKLTKMGAPSQLIATVHGRGYYLKPITGKQTTTAFATRLRTIPERQVTTTAPYQEILFPPSPEQQAQYLAFLNETWPSVRTNSLRQLEHYLQQITAELSDTSCTPQTGEPLQTQLNRFAHTLAGTTSIFGLQEIAELAKVLEQQTSQPMASPADTQERINLIQVLLLAIEQTLTIESLEAAPQSMPDAVTPPAASSDDPSWPKLILVTPPAWVAQQWHQASSLLMFKPVVVDTLDQAFGSLQSEPVRSSAILLWLPESISEAEGDALSVDLLRIHQHYPNVAMSVFSDHHAQSANLSDRLALIQLGVKFVFATGLEPATVLNHLKPFLENPFQDTKVLVVDDDQTWLQTLPNLLKPWGIKVSTLADPQQLGIVLQAIMPDALILDVRMPAINGLEVCQSLRSDPVWQQLPILFLSILNDPTTQTRALQAGADDYICKPVSGLDLANRILARLQRLRILAS